MYEQFVFSDSSNRQENDEAEDADELFGDEEPEQEEDEGEDLFGDNMER